MTMLRLFSRAAAVLLAVSGFAAAAVAQNSYVAGIYHEASCPSADPKTMIRMTRGAAQAQSFIPAPDCHPEARVRYLGVIDLPGPMSSSPSGADVSERPKRVHVNAYTRSDGTKVREHVRSAPRD